MQLNRKQTNLAASFFNDAAKGYFLGSTFISTHELLFGSEVLAQLGKAFSALILILFALYLHRKSNV